MALTVHVGSDIFPLFFRIVNTCPRILFRFPAGFIMKICLIVCLLSLPVVLSVDFITSVDFGTKHHILGEPNSNVNCDTQMTKLNARLRRDRVIQRNQCKRVNSFIVTPNFAILNICKNRSNGRLTTANEFNVVVCRTNSQRLPCTYTQLQNTMRPVTVECKGKRPIHYYEN